MNEQDHYHLSVPKVPAGTLRPLWSVMIPTYNCANYLRETLNSIIVQAPSTDIMQIEVVDDFSTQDDPKAVVEELGNDRVSFYRQPQNVGHIKNFQTCLERAQGQLVHLLHGDDYVNPGFYHKIQHIFESNPEIGAACCRHIFMDEKGHWQYISPLEQSSSGILHNWLDRIAVRQRIQTPSMVVRREVYEQLGGFDSRLSWTEDWEMWVRIAAHYPIGYEAEPLAVYRQHSNSSSSTKVRTGENIQDIRRAINIFKSYLPGERADRLSRQALENYAFYALNDAKKLAGHGDTTAAMNQIREALRCCSSLKVIRPALKLKTRLLHQTLFRQVNQQAV